MPRLTTLALWLIAALLCGSILAANTQPTIQSLNKMPLSFTKNMGQWDDRVLFRANSGGATMWFTKEGVTYQFTRRINNGNLDDRRGTLHVPAGTRSVPLQGTPQLAVGRDPIDRFDDAPDSIEQLILTAKFVGANANPEVIAEGQMEYKCNYFLGNDPTKWHTDVPSYEAIALKDIYPGIDLKYSGRRGNSQAGYEFVVAPGADVAQINIAYDGAESTSLDDEGKLILKTKWGDMIAAIKSPINSVLSGTASFSQLSEKTIGFKADGASGQALGTLSVGLVYSTYLGGGSDDWGDGIAVDGSGNAYVTGRTNSTNFPTQNPYQTDQGNDDVFVTKLSAAGNVLLYSTYFGGGSDDLGLGITVDGSGNAYVTGYTYSTNFPTQNPYQTDPGDGTTDVFVTKLSAAGNVLLYSTCLGGGSSDYGNGIAVDGSGNAYVTGYTNSTNFPTQNPYQTDQGTTDVFVTKLSAAGNVLLYSTYLGGGSDDYGGGIAVDGSGNAYATGRTYSTNFPTQNPYQTDQGTDDVFVTKLSAAGNVLLYSTYLGGGSYDYGYGIAVDGSGNAYVTGLTYSTNFPTQNPYQTDPGDGTWDVFVTKLSAFADTDLDGVPDDVDNCPTVGNPDQADTDVDGIGDACDQCTDTDGDGYGNPGYPASTCAADNCPTVSNPNQADADLDGIGDVCDACTDTDGDGYGNPGYPANTCTVDNCPTVSNPNQADADLDGIGDVCDVCTDTDGDGFGNPGYPVNTCAVDNCPTVANPTQTDTDADGVGNACDNCPTVANPSQLDSNHNGIGDACEYKCGDANGDHTVDISDVVYMIAYIFSGGVAPNPLIAGDANCDSSVDISDAVYLIAYIFSGGLAPCTVCE